MAFNFSQSRNLETLKDPCEPPALFITFNGAQHRELSTTTFTSIANLAVLHRSPIANLSPGIFTQWTTPSAAARRGPALTRPSRNLAVPDSTVALVLPRRASQTLATTASVAPSRGLATVLPTPNRPPWTPPPLLVSRPRTLQDPVSWSRESMLLTSNSSCRCRPYQCPTPSPQRHPARRCPPGSLELRRRQRYRGWLRHGHDQWGDVHLGRRLHQGH